MDKKIDTTCEHIRLRLIAAAVGLQQCTQTDGTEVLIPGTGKRILIGGDAYLAQMAAPAATTVSASGDVVTAFGLLREVLAQHDEQGESIRAEGDHPVPNPLAGRIRALLDSRVIEGQGDGKAFVADLNKWILRDFDPALVPSRNVAPLDDDEVARLRRVVRALGMESEVPDDAETLRGCLFSVLGQIARKLESRAAQAAPEEVRNQWISVDERLPELHQTVALLDEKRWMNTGSSDHNVNWHGSGYLCEFGSKFWSIFGEMRSQCLDAVTHWMPLPAAPSTDTDGSAA